jgi:hypothetical protein
MDWSSVWETPGLDANPAVRVINGWTHYITRQASIAGSVTNRSADVGSVTRVTAGAPIEGNPYLNPVQVGADGTFQMQATWDQSLSPAQTIVLRALESDTADPPRHYTGYGSAHVSVSDGAPVNGVTVQLGPVAETRISGTLTTTGQLAGGNVGTSLVLVFPNDWGISLARHAEPRTVPGSFDYTVPIAGTQTALVGFHVDASYIGGGSGSQRRYVAIAEGAPVSGLLFDIPAPVALVEPADGATIGTDTVFRWTTGPPGGSYDLGVSCYLPGSASQDGRDIVTGWGINTTNTEARVFSTPFLRLVPGMRCYWGVVWSDGDLSAPQGARWAAPMSRSAVLR